MQKLRLPDRIAKFGEDVILILGRAITIGRFSVRRGFDLEL